MPFFRRSFEPRLALARPFASHDVHAVSSLARNAARRYLTTVPEDLGELLNHEPAAVLEYENRVVAATVAGWRLPPNAWLRALLVDSRVDAAQAIPLLVPRLHRLLPGRGVQASYITLDEWSAPWARAPLEGAGYRHVMNVLGYDKVGMDVPSYGDLSVVVRRARPEDIAAVLRVDAECFPIPWGKGEEILGPALNNGPYFAVAEIDGTIAGYTYVTVHFAGMHAHLVRIAVVPAYQGRGVGVRLLAEVVRFCSGRRIELLSLNTQDYNTSAQRLYEWFGFRRTGETQQVMGAEFGDRG